MTSGADLTGATIDHQQSSIILPSNQQSRINNFIPPVVRLWGSGTPCREFIYSEDLADACVYIMERFDFKDLAEGGTDIRNTHINIGIGKDISIKKLCEMIKQIIGFEGHIVFDTTKPDGTMRKLLDVEKLSGLGWKANVSLTNGIQKTYENYLVSSIK